MNPHYDFDDIDDYVHDRMSTSDRAAFEQALESDAELARRVEALRAEDKILRMLRDEQLLTQFEAWDKEAADEKKTGTSSGGAKLLFFPRNWMAPAAAAAVLGMVAASIAFGWFERSPHQPGLSHTPVAPTDSLQTDRAPQQAPAPEEDVVAEQPSTPSAPQAQPIPAADFYADLAKRYHTGGDEFAEVLMGGNTDGNKSRYEQAVHLYENRRFQEALDLLQQPDSTRLQPYLFLRAHTYYRLGRYPSALRDFRAFRQFPISDYAYEAQWGEVLCLLRQMPTTEAALLHILRQMKSNDDHPYHQRASALLQDLGQ